MNLSARRRTVLGCLLAAALPRVAFAQERNRSVLVQYIDEPHWSGRAAYDAGHLLMPGLYAAFAGRDDLLAHFVEYFDRWMTEDDASLADCPVGEEANRIHLLHLAATFCGLASRSGKTDLVPAGFPARLLREFGAILLDKPAWGWEPTYFEGGIAGRLAFKLARKTDAEPRYYGAVLDIELMVFSALAELTPWAASPSEQRSCALADELAEWVLLTRGVATDDGGWLFQSGWWQDHPDYLWAGHVELGANLPPRAVEGIAEDSSHSHRLPVFLANLARLPHSGPLAAVALSGLEVQFHRHVLVLGDESFPAPRLTNYMDGRNGLYRYGYETTGAIGGYGPYQLSGILPEGWWGLLPGERTRQVWKQFAQSFPLPAKVVDTYVGPNTTDPRGKLVAWPGFFRNGFAEANVSLIANL